jgi:hypothetical protein
MAEWNPQANALFLEALDRPAGAARTAYLNQVCDSDEDLKAEVIALLEAHQRAGEFLSSPPRSFVKQPSMRRGATRAVLSSGPINYCRKSAKAGWASFTWPSKASRFAAPSR